MESATFGILSLIPVLTVIMVAVITRRSFEPMLLGGLIGYLILSPRTFLTSWITSLSDIANTLGWYYLLFVMCGILILLLEKSGGAIGFADLSGKFAKSQKSSLIMTWLLGIAIFLDDYLNCLGVGVAMRAITDKFKVPREFLAYVVNSTGAAVCLLFPVSTWAVYMAAQFELVGIAAEGQGMGIYISALPYMFYCWLAVIVVPLFATKILPSFGPMKAAWTRAENGSVFPESHSEAHRGEDMGSNIARSGAINFILPILVLTAVALYTGDIMLGLFLAVITAAVLYIPTRLMKPTEFTDCIPEGLKSMGTVLITMTASYVLNAVNTELGLTPYVLDTVTPLISGPLFPVITFLVLAALSFATASPWAMATVSFPIIMPMALAVGADPAIVGGALISGTAFGSHACFYGDAALLTCTACDIQPFEYARTSIPLIMVPTIVAAAGYLVLGFVMM